MPLTTDSLLIHGQVNSPSGTSHTISHPDAVNGTTEGSTILLYTNWGGTPTVTMPAGWELDQIRKAFRYNNTGVGELSWTFTTSVAAELVGYIIEVNGLDLVDPLDVAVTGTTSGTTANGGTRNTNTSALNPGSQVLAVAVFMADRLVTGDTASWSGYTNSFTELADVTPASFLGNIAVATRIIDGPGTFTCTATLATSSGTALATEGWILLFRAEDASLNAPLVGFTGYEFGTAGGMGNAVPYHPAGITAGTAGSPGTFGTGYAVESTAARDTGYGFRLTSSAAVVWTNALPQISGAGRAAVSFDIRAVSGSGTPIVAYLTKTGTAVVVRYNFTTEQFGIEWNGGTTAWQTGTTPLGTWTNICFGALFKGTTHTMAWWIETGDGAQTAPADLTGQSVGTTAQLIWGTPVAETFVMNYDNAVESAYFAAHPLMPHRVVPVVPEPTGTTVVGTAANFKRFTANGTLANVDGTEGALVDEIPPTISASADGVCQVTTATSDYLNLPMQNPTLAADDIIAGVRFVASEWGGTGSGTGTLGWRGYDGVTETIFVDGTATTRDPDSLTAASATYPIWANTLASAGLGNPTLWAGASNGAWTPTRLNAAAIRMGFSNDATPDMGATLVMLEVALRTAVPFVAARLTSDEDPEVNVALVTETLHPYNSGVRTYTVSNDDPTRTAQFDYSISGTPQTPVVVAPSDPPVEVTVGSDTFGEVDSTSFGWQ